MIIKPRTILSDIVHLQVRTTSKHKRTAAIPCFTLHHIVLLGFNEGSGRP